MCEIKLLDIRNGRLIYFEFLNKKGAKKDESIIYNLNQNLLLHSVGLNSFKG